MKSTNVITPAFVLFTVALSLFLGAQTPTAKAPAGSYSAKSPVTAADLRIAQRAAELLSSPEKWNRNGAEDCPAEAPTISLYCALDKASREVGNRQDDNIAVMQEARITADLMAPRKYGAQLVDYNNDPETTFQDVQEFFRILRNRLARRMSQQSEDAEFTARGQGVSQSRPPASEGDLRIVRRAKKILDSSARWNRADNRVCPPAAKTFSLYCALQQASREISGKAEHRDAYMQEARFVIEDIAPNAPYYDHRLMDFNNDPATTFFDVQKFFQLLEDRVTRRLAAQKKPALGN